MIELPESRVLAAQLNETIKGKRIVETIAGFSPHKFAFFMGEPESYPAKLNEKIIGETTSFGGRTETIIEDVCLGFFDGVNLRYFETGAQIPQKHQLLLRFEDGSFLSAAGQMYGGLMVYAQGELDDNFYYAVAKEKVDPRSSAFSFPYFMSLLEDTKKTLSAKAFLATEQRIPGIGNGVLQDILFLAGIHPKQKIHLLNELQMKKLYDTTKETLAKMIHDGGRNTEKDLYGKEGGYQTLLSAKTLKEPCPKCGGEIVRQAYLGGNVYYCPVCQPFYE